MARSIKDEVDPVALSLSGARLLQLLEPFLESLVPVEVVAMMCMCENNFLSHLFACLLLSKYLVIDIVLSKLSSLGEEHLFRLSAVQIPPPIC